MRRAPPAPARTAARKRRRVGWLAIAVLSLLVLGVAADWLLSGSGRSPLELIDYARRRLEGHPKLEAVALPVLDLVQARLSEPEVESRVQPLEVPRLPPNPATAAGGLQPGPDSPAVVRVGPNRKITRIADAAQMAADGAVIEIDPGDYRADVAIWSQRTLTIRGLGDRVRLIADGADAEGKALWVVRGGRVTIEGIEFTGARVGDGNGAGIRLETGHLLVRRCRFFDNQTGILTTNEESVELDVEDSEFSYTARSHHFTHAIYVGTIGRFRLSGSYLHHGDNGHLVKSRARVSRIDYNRITDESGGHTSYEVNLPNGGDAQVVGNIVQQGPGGGNSVIVSYGEEGYRWPVNDLRLVHNTLVNDLARGGTFVRAAPGAGTVQLLNNVFVGPGRVFDAERAEEQGNWRAQWKDLVRPSREDYRLTEASRAQLSGRPLAPLPPPLVPRQEYVHPRERHALPGPPVWPGALQSGP